MTVRRFFGETAREALRKVKAALGPEAVVIANKAVPGGVEILAMSADSLEALQENGVPPAAKPPSGAAFAASAQQALPAERRHAPSFSSDGAHADDAYGEEGLDYAVTLSTRGRLTQPVQRWQPPRAEAHMGASVAASEKPKLRPLPPRETPPPKAQDVLRAPAEPNAVGLPPGIAGGVQQEVAWNQLIEEMQRIRQLLERQMAGLAWNDLLRAAPTKAQLMSEMLEIGFSGLLTRHLMSEVPDEIGLEEGRKLLQNAIDRRLRTLGRAHDLVEVGGVYALVGPTGVGKTTTTAKLAARGVVRHGAEKVALVTTDGYRIGAHEQLRIYGRILNVPVHIVRDGAELERTLAALSQKHLVLIDTAGMCQRDKRVAEQSMMLARATAKRVLLLNAGSRGDTLDDVVASYAGDDLAGVILTKVDEAAALAPALDVIVRHGLLLTYVANGQRVPEDLHLPNRQWLLHRAFKPLRIDSAHRLERSEVGLIAPTACA
ncbi:MAG: flagellar biosynthesis protein FlhF [Rhodocyclaceae bacterium]|nr:flagellar biosynthesis protein FlhF [Rhodocyclaceae bacterium]